MLVSSFFKLYTVGKIGKKVGFAKEALMETSPCNEDLPCSGNNLTERLSELAKAVKEIEENRISPVELSNWVGFFGGKQKKEVNG